MTNDGILSMTPSVLSATRMPGLPSATTRFTV